MIPSAERLLIGRYLWPGRGGRLALLVAAIGGLGVMIGVAALVLVVAFMNGVDARMSAQIASVDGHLSITRPGHRLADWRTIQRVAIKTPGVVSAVPTLVSPGTVTVAGRVQAAELQGLARADLRASRVFRPGGALVAGRMPTDGDGVAIGIDLASRLGVAHGDSLAVTTVRQDRDDGLVVENTGFTIAGVVRTEVAAYDTLRVVMPIERLRALLRRPGEASRVDVTVADADGAGEVAAALRLRLGGDLLVRTWRELNPSLFAALTQERLAMGLAVSLVTLIALFNILSSMVMLVRFKTREIAILRTMGASRLSIARVFVVVGSAIGLAGGATGLAAGLGLAAAKDPLAATLRTMLASPPYELEVLLGIPLVISSGEIAWIAAAVGLGVIASTLYPAMKAAEVDPATALRY